jgi:hypothetical protein
MTARHSVAGVLALLFLWPLAAAAQGIRWAGSIDSTGHVNLLHAPDGRFTSIEPPATAGDFSPVMQYSSLARLLRGTRCDLSRADVIAFEGNGGHSAGVENGWESSVWTFSDGATTRTVEYDAVVGRASDLSIVCTGSILGADGKEGTGAVAYAKFFGICPGADLGKVISFILFDLHSKKPAVDVNSPSFTVRVANRPRDPAVMGDSGTPDADAIGVLAACPRR